MFSSRKSIILSLLVVSFIGYSSFIYINLPNSKTHSAEADLGKMAWQKYNCGACHQVYGLGGYLGPDITNVLSRRDSNYVTALIKHGTNIMPALGATDDEVSNLIAYLKTLNNSGSSDPRKFKIHIDGYISQETD